jgi:hypothetical protein
MISKDKAEDLVNMESIQGWNNTEYLCVCVCVCVCVVCVCVCVCVCGVCVCVTTEKEMT